MRNFIGAVLSGFGLIGMVAGVVYACSNIINDGAQRAALVIIAVGACLLLSGVVTLIVSNNND